MLKKFLLQTAIFYGAGLMPKAPGTWGTLAAIPLAAVVIWLGSLWQMGLTFLLVFVAIAAAEAHEKAHSNHDASEIVVDEVVGYLVTMMWMPLTWQAFVLGFLLFRFFDVLKPFPISYVDRQVKGGVGVVADDLVAGIIANIILQVILMKTTWLGVQIMGVS